MKKLIIAVAILCAAVISQAATCQWASGALKTATSKDGGWSGIGVNTAGAEVTMNIYFIDSVTFDSLAGKTQKELFDSYSTMSANLTAVNRNPNTSALIGAASVKDESTAIEGIMYAVVTATYTDATYGDMFMATTAKSVYNGSTKAGNAPNILSTVGARPTDGGWQAVAVPEPTSGLLLLLGMAGLALKRKRA